jgi:hypothetical protein
MSSRVALVAAVGLGVAAAAMVVVYVGMAARRRRRAAATDDAAVPVTHSATANVEVCPSPATP